MEFIHDREFLLKVNEHHVSEYWASVIALDFATELPLSRIEGKLMDASCNVSSTSSVRRTASMRFVADPLLYNITDLNNLIAINKKIDLQIGITNPLFHMQQYAGYGKILWFKQGMFLITRPSIQAGPQGISISCELTDKMGLLNGVCGGVLPASVSFHDRIIIDDEENITIEFPLIRQIIQEVVHHFGNEHPARIIINDIPDVGRRVVRYMGATPIHFTRITEGAVGVSYQIRNINPDPRYFDTFNRYDVVGYMETDLTYPGELVLSAGSTVVQVLDEIVNVLGNFEYFYDVDGNFVFQQIRNFNKTGRIPLNLDESYDEAFQRLYVAHHGGDGFINELRNTELITNISYTPNYSNISNDFSVWGTRETADKTPVAVRYRLAIDERPKPMEDSLCFQDIYEIRDRFDNRIIRYQTDAIINLNEVLANDGRPIAADLRKVFQEERHHFNWREELYRAALIGWGASVQGSAYDADLMAEWRSLYDPMSQDQSWNPNRIYSFERQWRDRIQGAIPWSGYNVEVVLNPERIRYWLDIIDSSAPIGAYSVGQIGRRQLVRENTKINEVFEREINDIVFLINDGINSDRPQGNFAPLMERIQYYISIGQNYSLIQPDIETMFEFRNSFGTCYEEVREMLYNSLIYNAAINVSCIPILYLDVNRVVRLNYNDIGINGDFIINSLNWSIGQNTQMSFTAVEAVVII